jgi:hypothetical protein
MPKEILLRPESDQPMIYQIRLESHLGPDWTDWFQGLVITLEENGDTLLTGPIVDQAALHGLLKKVRDLGMPLVSIHRIKNGTEQRHAHDQADTLDVES